MAQGEHAGCPVPPLKAKGVCSASYAFVVPLHGCRLVRNLSRLMAVLPDSRPASLVQYVAAKAGARLPCSLRSILADSPCPKGRLLHYFAPPAAEHTGGSTPASAARPAAANWCGWHHDNGSLTGLTSAMYLSAAGEPVACPDPAAGLHIRDRSGRVVQVGCRAAEGMAWLLRAGHILLLESALMTPAKGACVPFRLLSPRITLASKWARPCR